MTIGKSATRTATCLLFLIGAAAGNAADAAPVCGKRKITATGASSNMTFFARTRAKAAWIKKVSGEPSLGPEFSQWLRSRERRSVCRKVDNTHVCLAVALPCR